MAEAAGYILRIAAKQWVDQVFNMAIYYTSVRRKWQPGQTVLFVHKTNIGDAIVGYGMIETVYEKDELSEEEQRECEKWRWKKAIEFRYVVRFENPLRVKETILKDLKVRGSFLHGFPLSKERLEAIMTQAGQSKQT
jgi:hypothetical protein